MLKSYSTATAFLLIISVGHRIYFNFMKSQEKKIKKNLKKNLNCEAIEELQRASDKHLYCAAGAGLHMSAHHALCSLAHSMAWGWPLGMPSLGSMGFRSGKEGKAMGTDLWPSCPQFWSHHSPASLRLYPLSFTFMLSSENSFPAANPWVMYHVLLVHQLWQILPQSYSAHVNYLCSSSRVCVLSVYQQLRS